MLEVLFFFMKENADPFFFHPFFFHLKLVHVQMDDVWCFFCLLLFMLLCCVVLLCFVCLAHVQLRECLFCSSQNFAVGLWATHWLYYLTGRRRPPGNRAWTQRMTETSKPLGHTSPRSCKTLPHQPSILQNFAWYVSHLSTTQLEVDVGHHSKTHLVVDTWLAVFGFSKTFVKEGASGSVSLASSCFVVCVFVVFLLCFHNR